MSLSTPSRRAVLGLAAGLAAGCGGAPAPRETSHPKAPGSSGPTRSPTGPSQTPSQTLTPTPTPTPTLHPGAAERAEARRLVDRMSTSELAGQVIMATYDGTRAPTELIRRYHLGGVIVMGPNISSPGQVTRANAAMQGAHAHDRDFPLLISIDQEGGLVARLDTGVTEFPTYMTLGAAADGELTRRVARVSGTQLRRLGFTVVNAPDADVTFGASDPTIGSRSAGDDPHAVARRVKESLHGYAAAGIIPVIKHFPGHGSVSANSHQTLPVQDASLAELRHRDLIPFVDGVRAGAPVVMVAHLDVRAVDPGTPSSLSKKVVNGLLRDGLGFDGVSVTDALNMAAVSDRYGSGEAAVRALLAGQDLLLMPADTGAAHGAIVHAAGSGRLDRARLRQAATRVVALALHQRELANRAGPAAGERGAGRKASYAESLAGLTVVSGPCSGRLVGRRVRVFGGTSQERERFTEAASRAGLDVGDSGDSVVLLSRGSSSGSGDVVVALDTPYGLGRSDAETARIGLYGRTPQAFRALADVLVGKATGGGRLPVDVDGVTRSGCPR